MDPMPGWELVRQVNIAHEFNLNKLVPGLSRYKLGSPTRGCQRKVSLVLNTIQANASSKRAANQMYLLENHYSIWYVRFLIGNYCVVDEISAIIVIVGAD